MFEKILRKDLSTIEKDNEKEIREFIEEESIRELKAQEVASKTWVK